MKFKVTSKNSPIRLTLDNHEFTGHTDGLRLTNTQYGDENDSEASEILTCAQIGMLVDFLHTHFNIIPIRNAQ